MFLTILCWVAGYLACGVVCVPVNNFLAGVLNQRETSNWVQVARVAAVWWSITPLMLLGAACELLDVRTQDFMTHVNRLGRRLGGHEKGE
jgi:hypothetical protein